MSIKKIYSKEHDSLPVELRIYYFSNYNEYYVRLYIRGKLNEDLTYFTHDKDDAIITGESMLSQIVV